MERVAENRVRGVSFGGRLQGLWADPIAQCIALILAVSLVFIAWPGLDLWLIGLFAEPGRGFPLDDLPAIEALGGIEAWAVAAVAAAAVGAIVWKLLHPQKPTPFSADAIVFVLLSLVAISWLGPILPLAADADRYPPALTHLYGGHGPFVSLWSSGGGCTVECAAFSFSTSWAVWLVGAAALIPAVRRRGWRQVAVMLAVVFALGVAARGEDYLSGILISALASTFILVVVYRLTVERPVPFLAGGRVEAELTRAGMGLRAALRDADWAMVRRKAQSPWLGRRGSFSPLKAAVFAAVVLPSLWFVWLTIQGELTPLPWVFLIYATGIWALWFLLASLAVTPARRIFGLGELIAVRRMLGIAGLFFTVLHLADYAWLDRFSMGFVVNEYLTRPTIWVATLATLGIFILGATSFDAVIRRMGGRAWNRLHYLAYPAIGLAVLHFDMSPGSLDGTPFLMAGLFFWLMAWRVLHRYGKARDPLALAILGMAVTAFNFAFQVTWLALYQHISSHDTLGYSVDLDIGLPPPWQMLIVSLYVAALAALFGRRAPARTRLVRIAPQGPWGEDWAPVARALQAPLRDRAGRISPLKATTFALLFLPGLWLLWLVTTGGASPQPDGFAIYNSGVWAMWLLLFSLAVTPSRTILGWSGLIAVRRMVGLSGLAYTLLHAGLYFALEKTTWATVATDLRRLTIIVAITATLGLFVLAATSFDGAIRRLGRRDWNRLHSLAYPAVGLAMLHYDMGPESLGGIPYVMTGIFFWLMGWRVLNRFGRGADATALAWLAAGSAVASFAFEGAWLQFTKGYSAADMAMQLWNLDFGPAETWQVLIVGLTAAGLAAVFGGKRSASRLGRRYVPRSLQTT